MLDTVGTGHIDLIAAVSAWQPKLGAIDHIGVLKQQSNMQQISNTMQIKPGINADGFRTAVRDYTEMSVVEELGANSYDADASKFLVLLDSQNFKMYIVDNGIGFEEEAFEGLATLGAGLKKAIPYSKAKRHYLGSYGYGVKSTLNIATKAEVTSFAGKTKYTATLDWDRLDDLLENSKGEFNSTSSSLKSETRGTIFTLSLKNPTDKTHLESFRSTLANLPSDGGSFACYVGMYSGVAADIPADPGEFVRSLNKLVDKWKKAGKIEAAGSVDLADLDDCKVEIKKDKVDKSVSAKIFFAGFDGDKVKPLKKGLRGIYVRIHGRLLKQSFTERTYTYPISKWTKFESGLRVELEIDWLRDQITLSREGIRFENPKLQEDFAAILTRTVTSFIQPHLKRITKKKKQAQGRRAKQRLELARKRKKKDKSTVVPGLASGFIYRPETDAELAVLLSQPAVMKKVLKNHVLIDYNDQAPFDCYLLNEERDEFVCCELEPKLESFLGHNDASDVTVIIVWTKTGWRMGAQKKGKSGYLTLQSSDDSRPGRYKLLEYPSEKSKKPRRSYEVIVIDEILV